MSGAIQLSADEAALVEAIKKQLPDGKSSIRRVTTDAKEEITVIFSGVTDKALIEKAIGEAVTSLRADNSQFPDVQIGYEAGEIGNG